MRKKKTRHLLNIITWIFREQRDLPRCYNSTTLSPLALTFFIFCFSLPTEGKIVEKAKKKEKIYETLDRYSE